MDTMHEWEQSMVKMLARLPVPMVITLPGSGLGEPCYCWQCLEAGSVALSFEAALEQALCFAFYRVDETVLPSLRWLDWYPHGGV